jgi:hypothetical protein
MAGTEVSGGPTSGFALREMVHRLEDLADACAEQERRAHDGDPWELALLLADLGRAERESRTLSEAFAAEAHEIQRLVANVVGDPDGAPARPPPAPPVADAAYPSRARLGLRRAVAVLATAGVLVLTIAVLATGSPEPVERVVTSPPRTVVDVTPPCAALAGRDGTCWTSSALLTSVQAGHPLVLGDAELVAAPGRASRHPAGALVSTDVSVRSRSGRPLAFPRGEMTVYLSVGGKAHPTAAMLAPDRPLGAHEVRRVTLHALVRGAAAQPLLAGPARHDLAFDVGREVSAVPHRGVVRLPIAPTDTAHLP